MDGTFKKEERLRSTLAIQDLLQDGHSISSYPLKLYWKTIIIPGQKPTVNMAVSAPKKRFKRAVDRNLVKRRIRESYRKHKYTICEFLKGSDRKILMVILYVSNDLLTYDQIDHAVKALLEKLVKILD